MKKRREHVSLKDLPIDLALNTAKNSSVAWEIILGEFDQLASSISGICDNGGKLTSKVGCSNVDCRNEDGSRREEVKIEESRYSDYSANNMTAGVSFTVISTKRRSQRGISN